MSRNRERQIALLDGRKQYVGKRCPIDGSVLHNTNTGHCSECAHYKSAVRDGFIMGVDERTEGQKAVARAELRIKHRQGEI